jgi:hypothetical protein
LSLELVPEIVQAIKSFGDEIIREMSSQVKQDLWQGQVPSAVSVASPVKTKRADKIKQTNMTVELKTVSASYDWTVKILNHFFEEAYILLHPGGDKQQAAMTRVPSILSMNGAKTNSTGTKLNGYNEADVCECEPVLVAGALRILLRYCMEMESVEKKGLSQSQVACFKNTIKVILVSCIRECYTNTLAFYRRSLFIYFRARKLPLTPCCIAGILATK